ncbi:MAG: acetyl-CoA carboxylase biotin carboxyl carrier protein [Flavobacteriales bacterium]|jgi:acetyl-CoA carboxylase biotin carboxyl carrier protein|nr:acetyl-CoA carboxylase biotin carboxyl carrier protein [Flavobacteriales bacterium]
MDLKEIQNLIKFVAKSGASEVKLEMEDVKITIRTGDLRHMPETMVQQMPMQAPQVMAPQLESSTPVAQVVAEVTDETANYITIKSPIIGTFYRRPSPDKPLFANVGDTVSVGDTVCIIEAMKLFNEIESEISGKIIKILVDDASPVEFDQPLFLVDPS